MEHETNLQFQTNTVKATNWQHRLWLRLGKHNLRKINLTPWFSSASVPAYLTPEQDSIQGGYISYESAYFPLQSLLVVKGLTEFEWETVDYEWNDTVMLTLTRCGSDIEPIIYVHPDGTEELLWRWDCGFVEA